MESDMTKVRTAALALAGILAITATSASAQWRGHHHHGGHWGPGLGIGAGIAAGALVGAAVAARPYGGYYYEEPGYAEPYAYEAAPTYYGNYGYNGGYGQCFTDEGYGRRTACGSGPSR
jgi:hypothetical protein